MSVRCGVESIHKGEYFHCLTVSIQFRLGSIWMPIVCPPHLSPLNYPIYKENSLICRSRRRIVDGTLSDTNVFRFVFRFSCLCHLPTRREYCRWCFLHVHDVDDDVQRSRVVHIVVVVVWKIRAVCTACMIKRYAKLLHQWRCSAA